MSVVGPSRHFAATQQFSRVRSEADIERFSMCAEPVAIDPFRKSVRRKAIAQAARSSLTSRPAFGGQFELENRALPSSV